MRLGGDEACRLFFAVYPAFVQALPTVSAQSSAAPSEDNDDGPTPSATVLSRNNSITELRDEIKTIGITFNEEDALCELQDDFLHEARNALDQILFHFEDLVRGGIVESTVGNFTNDHSTEHFPKLVRLRYAMASHHAEEMTRFISFGTETRMYRRTISTAHQFNRNMRRFYPRVSGISHKQPLPDDQSHPAALAQMLRTARASSRLFAFLEQAVCRVNGSHEGYLGLSDFDQPEFNLLLSLCGAVGLWQQAYLRLADQGLQGGPAVKSICDELRQSLRYLIPARMVVDGTNLHRVPRTGKERFRTQPLPTKVTLGQILREEEERQKQGLHVYRILKRNKKRGLAVKIAMALLHLLDTPLLQGEPWTADTIYISHDGTLGGDSDPDPQAYISFSLGSRPAMPADRQPEIEADDGDPCLLALVAVLMELETERKIVPNNLDVDELSGELSLYMAVIRHHDELKGNIDVNFYTIIDDCLDLYTNSRDADGDGYCAKIQTELFTKVVTPLRERYEMFLNAGQPKKGATRTRDDSHASCDAGLDYRWARRQEEMSRQLSAIWEIAEDEPQRGEYPAAAAYTSLSIPKPQLLAAKIHSSWAWLASVDRTNELMDAICQRYPTANKVRVAILDTGCDVGSGCIASLSDGEARLEGHWKDWVGNSNDPVDEDPGRHGTMAAALLLRVARHAEVFVGRIVRHQVGLREAADDIAQAISYAATTWDVDVISMSFGFNAREPTIERALSDAILKRKEAGRDILFFAAANNNGLNSAEMFPASNDHVISVRGTDHSGDFLQPYNPNPWPNKRNQPRFGTLAKDVPYDCADARSSESGCSLATPILAGLVATVIQYVEHRGDGGLRHGVRTRDGILQVMDRMAPSTGSGLKYIAPWKFFERSDDGRIALIRGALDELQPSR